MELQICSYLPKKSLAENFVFCAVNMLTRESPISWSILLSVFLNTSSEILNAYRKNVELGFFVQVSIQVHFYANLPQ